MMGMESGNKTAQKIRSVKFNLIMNAILTLSGFIFPLITFPYVSRILLPEGTGKVDFATSVISYFSLFATLGVPTYGIRACAKVRDNKTELSRVVQELLIINLSLTLVVYIMYIWAVINVDRMNSDKTLFIVMGSSILFTTLGVEWMYKGLEQYSYITIRSVLFKFAALILMFLFVHRKEDYIIYGGITIFAGVGSNFLNFINLKKYIYLRPVRLYDFKRHVKPVIIFFAMSVATTIYTNLDKVMLGFMTTDIEVGYYGAAVKIKMILATIVSSLGPVLLPRATYYIEHDKTKEFKEIVKKSIRFVWVLSVPVTTYFILFSKESILLLSGEAYLGSVMPMQIIMPTVIFIGLTNAIGIQILVPLGKEKYVFISEVIGAIINLVINASLIPQYGAAGAAFGTLIAEFAVLVVQLLSIKNSRLYLFRKQEFWKTVISTVILSIICILFQNVFDNLLLTLVVTASIFFGGYYLMMLLLRDSLVLEITKDILKKIGR